MDVANGGGIGQVEGLAVLKEGSVLISNELFTRTLAGITFFVPQSLYSLNIKPWLPQSIILPVGISDLSAKVQEKNVLISWQYHSAEADYFDIEKSPDGQHFSKIGLLNNRKAFAGKFDYTDDAHFAGQQFYRIKVVLKDKNYSFSKILVVKGNLNEFFKLETSSFSNKIKIDFNSGKEQAVQLSLVDLCGRVLITRKLNCLKGNNQCELNNLSSLSKSVYFVTAKASDGLFVKKVVKD